MNLEIEKSFIEKFIKNEYKDRLIYEMVKKREKGLSRFSHDSLKIIKNNSTILNLTVENYFSIISKYRNIFNKECYFISRFYDGEMMLFDVALKKSFEDLCSSIIISNDFAIIKEETEKEPSNIYLIQSKKN